jgi:hypothetical protein
MSAFVRVSGPPNSNFLVGYPGISATLVRVSCLFLFALHVLRSIQPHLGSLYDRLSFNKGAGLMLTYHSLE